MPKQTLRKELGITSRKMNKMIGSALPKFDDYGTTNPIQYQVEKPEYMKNLILPDEPTYDYDETAETVLGQQAKNAVNDYFNDRETILFSKVPSGSKLDGDRKPTTVKIASRNNEHHTDGGNIGVNANDRMSAKTIRNNQSSNQEMHGNFSGNNYNYGKSKANFDKVDVEKKYITTSIKNHKVNGLQQENMKTLKQVNKLPAKNYYQQALKHYNNGNAFYIKPLKGSPEHAEVIKIMAKLKVQ